jgi:peptide/nickel transport system ATP-binding protein
MTALALMGLLPRRAERRAARLRLGLTDLGGLSDGAMSALRGRRMSMIFQEPMTALNPVFTIGDQLCSVYRRHTRASGAAARARAIEVLESVGLTNAALRMRQYPHQLSGGLRQRVLIAMALICEPELMICDEPTTALDVTTQAQILKLIRDLQREHNTGILFITHDFGVVAEIADRVAVLRLGELVEEGPANEVLNHPQHAYTKALIASVPALTPPEPKPSVDAQPVILKASALRKTFKARGGLLTGKRSAVPAVRDLSFELRQGETLGVVGESGSGKTTVSRIVTRLLEADSGKVDVNGRDFLSASPREVRAMRKDIQMVFQDPMASLNPRRRVVDLIAQGPIVHGVPKEQAHTKARELLELVELSPAAADRFPHEFSGGQRQRIGIARALALEPRIIVADEPVSALDVSVQAQVLRLLADLRERLNLSLLFVTHDLRVAAQLCDRIIVMSKGEIAEAGLTAQVFANPQHEYTQRLLASIPGKGWMPPRLENT